MGILEGLFKGWAAGFIGFAAVLAIVVLVSFLAGGNAEVIVAVAVVAIVAVLALAVALNFLKKEL